MAKKIYDIVPPKVAHKIENTLRDLEKDSKKKRPVKPPKASKKSTKPKQEKSFPVPQVLVGGAVVLLLLGIFLAIKLPKATVQLWPKLDNIILSETVTADKSVNSVDADSKLIPARYVEIQKDGSQDFPATGSASNEGRATGTVTLYNKINPSAPFTLIKGTHLLSDSGKYFITKERITIPAAKGKTPGSIDIKVEAEDSGSEYNIGPSKFSLPKLSGTEYYYSIYGASTKDMSGGYTGKVKKVTGDDLAGARDVLTKQLFEKAQQEFRGNLSEEDIVLDGATSENIVSANASVQEGAVADTFNQQASVKLTALVVKKQDLESFIKTSAQNKLNDGKAILSERIQLEHKPGAIDIQAGKETIKVEAQVPTYYSVSTNDLLRLFSGKPQEQIKKVVDQMYPEKISELRINFWPFWVSKAPKNTNRIKIDILFK